MGAWRLEEVLSRRRICVLAAATKCIRRIFTVASVPAGPRSVRTMDGLAFPGHCQV